MEVIVVFCSCGRFEISIRLAWRIVGGMFCLVVARLRSQCARPGDILWDICLFGGDRFEISMRSAVAVGRGSMSSCGRLGVVEVGI